MISTLIRLQNGSHDQAPFERSKHPDLTALPPKPRDKTWMPPCHWPVDCTRRLQCWQYEEHSLQSHMMRHTLNVEVAVSDTECAYTLLHKLAHYHVHARHTHAKETASLARDGPQKRDRHRRGVSRARRAPPPQVEDTPTACLLCAYSSVELH